MIYSLNEAKNVEEYRAEKAAREKAEQDKKDEQYDNRYYWKNKGSGRFITKTRADGHEDVYHAGIVGSRNRKVGLDNGSTKGYMFDDEDIWRDINADDVAYRNAKSPREKHEFRDAVNRNMRRHPERWDRDKPVKSKTESTIFDNIEII